MNHEGIERLRLSIEENLGLTVTSEQLKPMAREAEESGAITRTFGDTELTVFSYKRGSLCAAVGVVEIDEEEEEEEEEEED